MPEKVVLERRKRIGQKQTKSCSICKQPGHTKPTCPNKENLDQDVQKKEKVSASDLGLNPIFSLKCMYLANDDLRPFLLF